MVLAAGAHELAAGPALAQSLTPLAALIVVLGLGFLSRWVMRPSREQLRRREMRHQPVDFGLLVPVASVVHDDVAQRLRRRLEDAGIRATVAPPVARPTYLDAAGRVKPQPPGPHTVLVFRDDEARARAALSDFGAGC